MPLAASLSDDAFLAFVKQLLDNPQAGPARAADAALLQPLYDAQRTIRQAAGMGPAIFASPRLLRVFAGKMAGQLPDKFWPAA